jgi:CheY-like chemotaxis protein
MPGERKTILLVEDDPVYAAFVSSSLTAAGLPLQLHHVSTLDAALAYVRGQPPYEDRPTYPMPAIVLLDVILSQQRGFPFLKFLSENGHLENEKIRVIMLTASDDPKHIQEALRLGAISYLIKSPVSSAITQLVTKFADC